jgi:3-hydroxypropanoate dehydrogenase
MTSRLSETALDQLLRTARTHNAWLDKPIDEATLRALVDLTKMGPTSANCQPARLVFIKSDDAKARLRPHLSAANAEKTMRAPVSVIIGQDMKFYDELPRLFPHNQTARSWFAGNDAAIAATALRNSSLQGGYLILAARALGLDCGPMSGFDAAGVDAAFFAGTSIKTNFLCNLGYGDPSALMPRSPRLSFDEMAKIV